MNIKCMDEQTDMEIFLLLHKNAVGYLGTP